MKIKLNAEFKKLAGAAKAEIENFKRQYSEEPAKAIVDTLARARLLAQYSLKKTLRAKNSKSRARSSDVKAQP